MLHFKTSKHKLVNYIMSIMKLSCAVTKSIVESGTPECIVFSLLYGVRFGLSM